MSVSVGQRQPTEKVGVSWTALNMFILLGHIVFSIVIYSLVPFWEGIEEVREGTQEKQ